MDGATPERGIYLAKFQRPGVKIVMGAESFREERITALQYYDLRALPGHWSFQDRDLHKLLGFVPSAWAKGFAITAQRLGHEMTAADWAWLAKDSTGLADARAWIERLTAEVAL